MARFKTILTNRGATALALAMYEGGTVLPDFVQMGSGIYAGAQAEVTEIVTPLTVDVRIAGREFIEATGGEPSKLQISLQTFNTGLTTATPIREILLYANSNGGTDMTNAIPFAYAWLDGPDTDNILPPPLTPGTHDTIHLHELVLFVTNQEVAHIEVSFTFNSFVTHGHLADTLEQHNTSDTAHENRFAAITSAMGGVGNIVGNHLQDGANLEAVHAAEISASPHNGNVWSWIRARIRAGNYSGIRIGDWIQITVSGNVVIMEVAGINTYTRSVAGGTAIPNHIDFISRNLFPEHRQFNRVPFNNGILGAESPWAASDLRAWLNGLQTDVPNGVGANPETISVDYTIIGLFPRLPEQLRAVIVRKNSVAAGRFSFGVLLTDDNVSGGGGLDNLWIPSEVEVFGIVVHGTCGISHAGGVQYPIFANNMSRVTKTVGGVSLGSTWWLMIPQSGNSSAVSAVQSGVRNIAIGLAANTTLGVPLCFRIA
ncbi:MAG: DUF6273 domain-containing protein [Defluviitaleaceae bacterium]|nr:DUF6273 domain-containing protein [Defluviitaleaceae bacterium]